MKFIEREQIHLFFGSLALLAFLSVFNLSHASVKQVPSVSCKTNFGEKAFTIEQGTVAFHTTENKAQRSISSVYEARTQRTQKGLRRSLYLNGNKHLIHINDVNNLSDQEDYLAVTSQKGHKMTYPLNCKLVK